MMSKTPIYDFVKKYAKDNNIRLHMPGHKGKSYLGCEMYDITEIGGADSLFEAEGIINESEKNLSQIFSTRASFYSTEGSSLCIRAMLFMAMQYAEGKKRVLAGRNAHKSFMSALALCDLEADWLYGDDLYSCNITPQELDEALCGKDCFAVYVTSPDYLGNTLDIKGLSDVCHKHNLPLIVDNAHGAYLKFVGNHPLDNGADMCCDSAHKTLPCLTGSAYLHVSRTALHPYEKDAKRAMSLFASTSPSYLLLASMDKANEVMDGDYKKRVLDVCSLCDELKTELSHLGIGFSGREKLKINIKPKSFGYNGKELSQLLGKDGITPEFCDSDNLVLMFSADNTKGDFERLTKLFRSLDKRTPIEENPPSPPRLKAAMSVRDAVFSRQEKVPVRDSAGRILSSPCVSCPPAIPIAVCGEAITKEAIECFEYYGITQIDVVKNIK